MHLHASIVDSICQIWICHIFSRYNISNLKRMVIWGTYLCLIKHYATQLYMAEWWYSSISWLLLSSREKSQYPPDKMLALPHIWSEQWGKEKNFDPARNQTLVIQSIASFMPQPLYPQGKGPPYLLDRRLGWLQSWSGHCEEKILDPTGMQTLTLDHPACSQSLYQLCYLAPPPPPDTHTHTHTHTEEYKFNLMSSCISLYLAS
jgi:hypothetical protein